MPALGPLIGGIARALCYVAMAALALLLMGVTVIDVVMRWLGSSVPGAHELVTLGMRILIPLAFPYVFWIGGHVAVEMLTQRFPAQLERIVQRLGTGLGALVMAYLTVAVTQRAVTVWRSGEVSSDLAFPLFYYWFPLIVGCAFSVAVALYLALAPAPPAERGPAIKVD